jgi:hypothetical protein
MPPTVAKRPKLDRVAAVKPYNPRPQAALYYDGRYCRYRLWINLAARQGIVRTFGQGSPAKGFEPECTCDSVDALEDLCHTVGLKLPFDCPTVSSKLPAAGPKRPRSIFAQTLHSALQAR